MSVVGGIVRTSEVFLAASTAGLRTVALVRGKLSIGEKGRSRRERMRGHCW